MDLRLTKLPEDKPGEDKVKVDAISDRAKKYFMDKGVPEQHLGDMAVVGDIMAFLQDMPKFWEINLMDDGEVLTILPSTQLH